MCWFKQYHPKESCGFPPGTIRAILSIFIIISIISVQCFLVVYLSIQNDYQNAINISAALFGQLGIIIGFYFGSKSKKIKKYPKPITV